MRRADIPSRNTAAIVLLLVAHSGCDILSISGLAKDRRLSCPEHTYTHYICRLVTRSLEVSGAAVAGEPRRCNISPSATPITLLRHRAHSISAKSETLSPVDLAPGLCARRNSKSSVDEASSRQWLERGSGGGGAGSLAFQTVRDCMYQTATTTAMTAARILTAAAEMELVMS